MLLNIVQAARSTTKYSIMLNQPISSMDFWKRPLLDPLMKVVIIGIKPPEYPHESSNYWN